jgi:hypothetical protein
MGGGVRRAPQLRADVATQEGYVSKFVCEDGAKTTLAKASRSRTEEVIENMESVVCVVHPVMRRTSWRTKSCCDEPERDLAAHTGRRPRALMRTAPVDASRGPRQAVDVEDDRGMPVFGEEGSI